MAYVKTKNGSMLIIFVLLSFLDVALAVFKKKDKLPEPEVIESCNLICILIKMFTTEIWNTLTWILIGIIIAKILTLCAWFAYKMFDPTPFLYDSTVGPLVHKKSLSKNK
eukprot:CAMPEP_0113939010 /NCGR_PEP_ID=MMETSP1339-20121228/5404_1 /TAXON_ID=94617 /ORGANISM="Fibrocapsa japonica" /LENGTH=109 /DNA_ID=CAMNT_0000942379 /DNA_START=77 /DNA_END=406 /DNA_ORIENTATION=- /assembly_acc=CAM_ASM_000762